ncbi:hypothetical protein BpHYR1_034357 [Brachionus plicatilis]|uniref:Uncharacterized protein n=1 Tax=Brachionus plicatilis TaxID=10195 RepID=A0A3M7PH70_BRAPC|nr:hypothetical protein BpHYR1_034357 [Brachionus plicatilis]
MFLLTTHSCQTDFITEPYSRSDVQAFLVRFMRPNRVHLEQASFQGKMKNCKKDLHLTMTFFFYR